VKSLRRRFLRQLLRVGWRCEQANRQETVDWDEEALRVDPCAEKVCRSLTNSGSWLSLNVPTRWSWRLCACQIRCSVGGLIIVRDSGRTGPIANALTQPPSPGGASRRASRDLFRDVGQHTDKPRTLYDISASACSRQNLMSIARYIVVAVVM
jgi:hypothetical protein